MEDLFSVDRCALLIIVCVVLVRMLLILTAYGRVNIISDADRGQVLTGDRYIRLLFRTVRIVVLCIKCIIAMAVHGDMVIVSNLQVTGRCCLIKHLMPGPELAVLALFNLNRRLITCLLGFAAALHNLVAGFIYTGNTEAIDTFLIPGNDLLKSAALSAIG